MQTQLVSVTKSLLTEKNLTPEELIIYIARVSNPANQLNSETADKLVSYLIKNKHWSPFEMVDMTIEIVTSRGIAQQILRHRSFSYQEFSQRYATVTDFEPVQLRRQADKNRQSSSEEFDPKISIDAGNDIVEDSASLAIQDHISYSENLYKALLTAGVAKECARFVLPITTQTKIYMKGSIRSWIHYLQIRCDEHTQLEHRQIASEIQQIFKTQFPNISKALLWEIQ
jgi:thymidylate synthase (FAD)